LAALAVKMAFAPRTDSRRATALSVTALMIQTPMSAA
jgi:hypothetical protein